MIGSMQKIAFQASVLTQQDSGGDVETMTTVYECFAWARPTSSNRTFLHNEGVIIDSYNFDVQYTTNFTPTKSHSILYRGKVYAINGITNIKEKRRIWRIFAIAET
jgi:SPP1 family predicted phage head-tail adaptor